MVGRKKKIKTCAEGSQEDWISHLPDALISDILSKLPTKDAVKTSVLSTKWTSHWKFVPALDLDSCAFSKLDAFVSFTDRFILSSHKESWIRKLRLRISCHRSSQQESFLNPWIDAVTMRRIQHLDIGSDISYMMPLSIYTCETLVHLRLHWVTLVNAEFVFLPCLKILHLDNIKYLSTATLEKLISGSPVLEDLTIVNLSSAETTQVRSQRLKRIHIKQSTNVVIDAPLLQCFRTEIYSTKNYQIISSGFPAKLDIDVSFCLSLKNNSLIHDILTDISRVRDLVIRSNMWKVMCVYSESRPLSQFRNLSRLNATVCKSDLNMLPILLESCQELKSLILEVVDGMGDKKNIKPKVLFTTIPRCLVSSLRFVELKRSIPRCEGELELVRYILKNSTILEKLRLDIYYAKTAKCAFLTELVAMPRCSSACEVIVL